VRYQHRQADLGAVLLQRGASCRQFLRRGQIVRGARSKTTRAQIDDRFGWYADFQQGRRRLFKKRRRKASFEMSS
jgi:hypothetical protein